MAEDNGPGIEPDAIASVVEPLCSFDGRGIGLGLPVAAQIMERHGGGLEIQSKAGHGTGV